MTSKACVICGRRRHRGDYCYGHYRLSKKGLPLDTPLANAKPTEPCSIKGCEEPHSAKGLCSFHYGRKKRGVALETPFDSRPTGPYRNVKGTKSTYEERVVARKKKAPKCGCGCGELTKFSNGEYRVYAKGHYRGFKPYKDETWLREQYEVKQQTIDEIAEECGVTGSSVKKFMVKFGIAVRPQAESLRIGGKVSGKNNPAWKGGTTPERQRLYKSKEWKELVLAVWSRDGFNCQRCGVGNVTRTNRLHAHHIGTWAEYPELRSDMKNLVTLCRECHQWVHSNANRYRRFLKKGSRRHRHETSSQPRKGY